MKKVVMILTVLLLSMSVFAGGIRVKSMGGIYSLIESTNYADFPQRLLTGGELACIGAKGTAGEWGLVRMKLNNFLNLPIPIAWQIKADFDMVTIQDLYDDVNMPGYMQVPASSYDESSQRINSIFAFGLSEELIAGVSIQLYSNSLDFDGEVFGDETIYDHSFWGLKTVWGATMMLGGDDFVDFGLLFDTWSWDVSRTVAGDDIYATDYSQCDGIMKFGLNARYYNTGTKVDYAPYMKVDMFSFSATRGGDENGDPYTAERTDTYDGSVLNFVLGSGVHYKPVEGVKVYNEFEFAYNSVSTTVEFNGDKTEDTENAMTLLPTYRFGVEITKVIDPKTWWGFEQVQLWGGFNKTFYDVWGQDERIVGAGVVTDLYTDSTWEVVNVTTGAALSSGNFKFEFTTNLNNLAFDDTALNNVEMALDYYFK
ncbi:MAG: hypothetical protein PF638_15560 [Candidatus Delongbacteria bacterium]|jgi:hypothetical protein|nr:hypothetical protein [Candidatus Delongbacteria bacterium]